MKTHEVVRAIPLEALPEEYGLSADLRPGRFGKILWAGYFASIILLFMTYAVFHGWVSWMRPEFRSTISLHFEYSFDRIRNVSATLGILLIVFIAHELIHALCLWMISGKFPMIRATLKGGGGMYVRLPSWCLSRNAFLLVDLAPVCLITLIGLLLPLVIPLSHLSILVFCLSVHAAGSTGDLASSAIVFLQSPSTYLTTDGMLYTKRTEEVPVWKQKISTIITRALERLK